MQRIKTVKAKDNLKKLISRVNKTKKAITLINSKGEKAILISEREWNNIKETLYLTSIPGLVKILKIFWKQKTGIMIQLWKILGISLNFRLIFLKLILFL